MSAATTPLSALAIVASLGGLLLAGPATAQAQVDRDSAGIAVRLEPVADGLVMPIHVTSAGDGSGSLYVVEQGGTIRRVDATGQVAEEPFLDLSDAVVTDYEQGLLGLAFHPDYVTNGRFFVDYTAGEDGATVVSEFRASEGRADRDSERVILRVPQPFPNHNGGSLAFDAEGHLLIGMGDGGGGGDPLDSGQDPRSLLGKLLRLDVDASEPYTIPADNGYVDDPTFRPEIHASGLRNPWRFSVDPATGDILIGDVGQGQVEEVSVLVGGDGGVSLGWNRYEGDRCFREPCDPDAHLAPAITYGRDEGCTVIGGHVYRGTAQPSLEGLYLFGDYCSGTIWAASVEHMREGPVTPTRAGRLEGTLVAFGVDEASEILAVDQDGRLLHVVAEPP
jgi:hypothetical protein